MQKLDRKDFQIAFKTGSDANKSKFAKECVQGELYVSDEALYVASSTAGSSDSFLFKFLPPFGELNVYNTEVEVFNSIAPTGYIAYAQDTGRVYISNGTGWVYYNRDFINNHSLSFDGTNDYLDPSSTFTDLWSGSFSISFWLKTPSTFNTSGADCYLGNDFVAGQGFIEFRQGVVSSSAAKIEFYFGNAVSNSFSLSFGSYGAATSAVLSPNTWYHIVITADRPASGTTTATLYINGSVESSLTPLSSYLSSLPNAGGTWSNNTFIGARNTVSSGSGSGELFLEGYLDEMAFFNSVLSASDVTSIYNNGTPNFLFSYNPVNWWRMGDNDGGSGTTITDIGSGGNDATLQNGPTFSTDTP